MDEVYSAQRLVESAEPVSTLVNVTSVVELTDRFRRIVVSGDGLGSYRPLPADVFRLLIPSAGENTPVMASYGEDGFPFWPDDVSRPTLRTYSVRQSTPTDASITFDVGRFGRGPHWVDRIEPADRFGVVGMRHGFVPPADVRRVVLVADASALPATAAILEALGHGIEAIVIAEAPTPAEQALIPERPNTTTHWTVGTTSTGSGSPLERLARTNLERTSHTSFRIAAELGVAHAVRHFLLDKRGVDTDKVRTIVQWQAGLTSDERDAGLLPRFQRASAEGLDLRDIGVLEALDLNLPHRDRATQETD